MSVKEGTDTQRFELSDHMRQHLKYEKETRCLEKRIISDAILYGDRTPVSPAETTIHHEVDGITFRVIVNPLSAVVVTAYPVKCAEHAAITSNRWTQGQMEAIYERVKEGKTKLV